MEGNYKSIIGMIIAVNFTNRRTAAICIRNERSRNTFVAIRSADAMNFKRASVC